MKDLRTALITAMLMALGAGPAEAQRATISASPTSATEEQNVEVKVSATWAYDVEVEYFAEDISATEGTDYDLGTWTACIEGTNTADAPTDDYCEFGGAARNREATNIVAHFRDDLLEGNETYRLVARVLRWETGRLDSDGLPEVRECSGTCGRATTTVTIIDSNVEEEPEAEGRVSFTTETASVEEGDSIDLSIKFTPQAGTSHRAASVAWATEDHQEATEGVDYTGASGTVNFSACSSSCEAQTRSIRIRTIEDEAREADEGFLVRLSNPTNATIERADSEWVQITIEDDEENGLPRVELTARKTRVEAGGEVELIADAVDDEGPIESYEWSGAGRFRTKSSQGRWETTWTAPRPHSESQYTLTVTVTDSEGGQASDSVTITVEGEPPGPANKTPTVSLTASSETVAPAGTVTLTAQASDTDGTIASYSWSGGGSFSGTGATTTWTAPRPHEDTSYVLEVTATDDDGATASATVDVRVVLNRAPTVVLVADTYTPARGGTVTLTATGNDSDGSVSSYAWSGGGTFASATTTTGSVVWTAPSPDTETDYRLTVTVTDDDGARGSDSVEVTVPGPAVAANQAPTFSAITPGSTGHPGEILSGVITASGNTGGSLGGTPFVTQSEGRLSVRVNDADGTVVSADWAAEGRLRNAAINNGTATISWRPPHVRNARNTTVSLTITDDDGATATTTGTWRVHASGDCIHSNGRAGAAATPPRGMKAGQTRCRSCWRQGMAE